MTSVHSLFQIYSAFAKQDDTATTMTPHGICLKNFIILAFTGKYNEFWQREREREKIIWVKQRQDCHTCFTLLYCYNT
jgi:hypothetical protein